MNFKWFAGVVALVFSVLTSAPVAARSVTGNASDSGPCGGAGAGFCMPCEDILSGSPLCQDYFTGPSNSLSYAQTLDEAARASGWERDTHGYTAVMGASRRFDQAYTDRQVDLVWDMSDPDPANWTATSPSDNALFDLVVDQTFHSAKLTFLQPLPAGPFMLVLTSGDYDNYQCCAGNWTGVHFFGPGAGFAAGAVIDIDTTRFGDSGLVQASIYAVTSVPEPGAGWMLTMGLATLAGVAGLQRRRLRA